MSAINKVTYPATTPAAVSDYQKQNAQIAALVLVTDDAQKIIGTNVVKGSLFNVGGTPYLADGDVAISGVASAYVKLTPSVDTLTLAPSYVASLTGVTWNSTYNGYYDVSGNLYVFDEILALASGAIATAYKLSANMKNISQDVAKFLVGQSKSLLPVGTILMFDANNAGGGSGGASGAWVDNVTMPGWYACIAANAAYGCPDLESKFIQGKAVAGAGAAASSNLKQISESQMPQHSHSYSGAYMQPYTPGGSYWAPTGPGSGVSTSSAGSGANFDVRPANYTAIYIRRCA